MRLLRAEERREVQEAEWVLVRGTRSLLRGASRLLPGDPFGGAAAGDCAAGALARLRAAGWPAEGESVSVNAFLANSTNEPAPIAPSKRRRFRQRKPAASG